MTRASFRLAVWLSSLVVAIAPLAGAEPGPARDSSVTPSASAAPAASTKRDFTDEMPCSACHTTAAWRAKGASGTDRKFDHSKTGFPLTGQHVGTPCTDCHNAQRVVKRDCASCHDDFHRGRLSEACDKCHSPAGWRITRPLDIHRFTRFPLTGMHVLADCTECHVRASEQKWTDAPIACFACHEKDYRRPGIFPVHAGTATTPPLPRDCSTCHRSIAWVPANQVGSPAIAVARAFLTAPANHDLRFPISFGAHRTAACADCHASQAAPRAVRCIGCHAHEPAMLMQQHKQPVPADGPGCLSCHVAGVRR